jgi:hypothetical protein
MRLAEIRALQDAVDIVDEAIDRAADILLAILFFIGAALRCIAIFIVAVVIGAWRGVRAAIKWIETGREHIKGKD